LKDEVLVVPAAVAFVVLQELVITDAGSGKDPEIHADLIAVKQVASALKEQGVGPLVIGAEGRPDRVVARVTEANAHRRLRQ
jgi:hypothetical protein